MKAIGHCVPGVEGEARGAVRLFPTPEVSKNRCRVIKHTADINDAYNRDTLMGTRFMSRETLIHSVCKGRFTITLDFAA